MLNQGVSIVALFLLGRKLRKSPRFALTLIAAGVLAAEAMRLASAMLEYPVAPEVVASPPVPEIYISSFTPIDNQSDGRAEEAMGENVLRFSIPRPVIVSDEDAP